MLGGELGAEAAGGEAPRAGPAPARARPGAVKASPAMDVAEFVGKGGGASLPRKQQERRDKEKRKRMSGQSAIATWKTEGEMQLRQLYDS